MDFFLKNLDFFVCVLVLYGSEVLEEFVVNLKVDCKVYYYVIYGIDRVIRIYFFFDLLDENWCKVL